VSLTLSRQEDTSITNILPATVVGHTQGESPAHVTVRLDAAGTPLLARITRRSRDQLGLVRGKAVWAQIKAVALLG
jgi:molybdate transport system ATP-binding protein